MGFYINKRPFGPLFSMFDILLNSEALKSNSISNIRWNSKWNVLQVTSGEKEYIIPHTFDSSLQFVTNFGVLYDGGVNKWCLRVSFVLDGAVHNGNLYLDYSD